MELSDSYRVDSAFEVVALVGVLRRLGLLDNLPQVHLGFLDELLLEANEPNGVQI
jgi:hypothetical protein